VCRFRDWPNAHRTKRHIESSGLTIPILGHGGDGNSMPASCMMDDLDLITRAKGFIDRFVGRAIEMDGTCTGEHGVHLPLQYSTKHEARRR
jgi:D-lactate dehydrogenase (cytochrome)